MEIVLPLEQEINTSIDDPQHVQMQLMRPLLQALSAIDLVVLLLEEAHEPRTVMAPVALGPQADAVIPSLVVRELEEPRLQKMPQRVCGLRRAVRRAVLLPAAHGANHEGHVRVWHTLGEVGRLDDETEVGGREGRVGRHVIGEADLVGLVDVEHVDLVVPAPRVQRRGFRVGRDEARSVFFEQAHDRGAAGAAVQPDGEGGGRGVLARFEEPEESELIGQLCLESDNRTVQRMETHVLTG